MKKRLKRRRRAGRIAGAVRNAREMSTFGSIRLNWPGRGSNCWADCESIQNGDRRSDDIEQHDIEDRLGRRRIGRPARCHGDGERCRLCERRLGDTGDHFGRRAAPGLRSERAPRPGAAVGRRRGDRRDCRRRHRQPVRPWLRPRRGHRHRRRRRLGDRQQRRGERGPASVGAGAALPHRQRLREPRSSATTSSTSTTASATRRACRATRARAWRSRCARPPARAARPSRRRRRATARCRRRPTRRPRRATAKRRPPTTTHAPAYYGPAPVVLLRALLRAVLRRAGGDRRRPRLLARQTPGTAATAHGWHGGHRAAGAERRLHVA